MTSLPAAFWRLESVIHIRFSPALIENVENRSDRLSNVTKMTRARMWCGRNNNGQLKTKKRRAVKCEIIPVPVGNSENHNFSEQNTSPLFNNSCGTFVITVWHGISHHLWDVMSSVRAGPFFKVETCSTVTWSFFFKKFFLRLDFIRSEVKKQYENQILLPSSNVSSPHFCR